MIAPQAHEPVEPEARKYLTQHQKIARWNELGRCCTICGEPCAPCTVAQAHAWLDKFSADWRKKRGIKQA